MQEQELFETYELKGWQPSPRLYKIVGASAVINLVVFVLMAQANFLTGKTCDSPIASGVCSVLDTLYVGGMILDSDATFVSKPYDATEIGDAEDITFIEVGTPLTYPAGYFALANPDQLSDPMIVSSEIPGISTQPGDGNLMNTTPDLPTDNGAVLDAPLPDNPLGNPTQVKTRRPKVSNNSPKNLPKIDGETTAENNANPNTTSEPVKLGEINRVPLEDLGDELNEKLAKNEIDLSKNFEVIMDGTITADGKLDAKKTKFIKSEGNEQMIEAAKDALTAMGDSGFLGLLKEKGIEKIRITLVQNDNEIFAILLSDMKTPEKAATTASILNTALQAAKFGDDNNLKKLDETSRILVDNSKLTSEGKNFRLDFKLPKKDALVIIRQTLDKRAEKKNKQPNSSGEVKDSSSDVTTAR